MTNPPYPIPSKRDIDTACVLINGLTKEQRDSLEKAAIDSCAWETRQRDDLLHPFLIGFLIGYMAREVKR